MTAPLLTAIVDASARARGFISLALEADKRIGLVGSWQSPGQLLEHLSSPSGKRPQVVFLDVETAGGLEAIPGILTASPGTRVLALASSSEAGAAALGQAMQRGASGQLTKVFPNEDGEKAKDFAAELLKKAVLLAPSGSTEQNRERRVAAEKTEFTFQPRPPAFIPRVLAIAASTGGPKSLVSVFEKLRGRRISIPVFITQHMPKEFTEHFAAQLEQALGLPVKEGKEGEAVKPGCVYVAPGDYHMTVSKNAEGVFVHLNQDAPENFCRPAADPMIRSLVAAYGHAVLLVVLTGMGADGLKGAELVVKEGGMVLAQDQATSVVWGMPGAVATAGLAHKLYPLDAVADAIIEHSAGKVA